MKKIKTVLFLILLTKISFSQIIDRYGFNAGISYSTQFWNPKILFSEMEIGYKVGLMFFLSSEKCFEFFGLKTEIGYIQKGFSYKHETKSCNGGIVNHQNRNILLHDLALNICLKINPIKFDNTPYLLVGFRGDYLMSPKDVDLNMSTTNITGNLYGDYINNFNKYNLGCLLGVGIDFEEMVYIEIEYNPNFTKNLDKNLITIRDNCFGIKIGVYI